MRRIYQRNRLARSTFGKSGCWAQVRRNERKDRYMSIAGSLILIAVGAILRWAVTLDSTIGSTTINWHLVGDVLMAVGVVGLVITLIWMMSARRRTVADPYVAEERPVYPADDPRVPR
jgi:hypothetical protein